MQLKEIAPETYAKQVLAETAALWARGRDLPTYAAETMAIARSRFGKRHYRTVGLYERNALLASFKRYDRAVQHGSRRLRAVGIGAVFTPKTLRGRGYATMMLGGALDQAREQGYDLVYLFSDIAIAFYTAIGFVALPSRELALRADNLPAKRVPVSRLGDGDWRGVARCFDLCARGYTGLVRTPLVWEWIRMRTERNSEHDRGQQTNLVVRHGRGVGAYVLGVRVPERDAYILDEFGFADAQAALLLPSLLRAAAGDLRRIVGWLPPEGARELLPRGSVRKRRTAIMMAAPLTAAGERLVRALAQNNAADCCWATDHI